MNESLRHANSTSIHMPHTQPLHLINVIDLPTGLWLPSQSVTLTNKTYTPSCTGTPRKRPSQLASRSLVSKMSAPQGSKIFISN